MVAGFAFLKFRSYIMAVKHSRTVIDVFADLYDNYVHAGLDDIAFHSLGDYALKRVMMRRGLTDTTELKEALDVFEYELDPSDPAFCYAVRNILHTMLRSHS